MNSLLHYIYNRTPDYMLKSCIRETLNVPVMHDKSIPPFAVRQAATKGINRCMDTAPLIKEGRGHTAISAAELGMGPGIAIALKLRDGKRVSLRTIKKIHAYFESGSNEFRPALYGGKAGRKWVSQILASIHDGDKYFTDLNAKNKYGFGAMSRETLIYMSPADFLKMAVGGFNQSKQDNVNFVGNTELFDDIPFLTFDNNGDGTAKVVGHEGRHRARFLQTQNIKQMPVRFISREGGKDKAIRWGKQTNPDTYDYVEKFPTVLYSEDGEHHIPFPQSVIFPIYRKVQASVRGPIIDNIIHIRSSRDIDLAIKKHGKLRAMLFDNYMDAWNAYDYGHLHYTQIIGGDGIKLSIERDSNPSMYLVEFNIGLQNDTLNSIKNNRVFRQVFKGLRVHFENFATDEGIITLIAKEFEEDQHPRADDGEFAPKNGGGVRKENHVEATKDENGKHKANDGGDLPEHIKKLGIPPAWTHVSYNTDPNSSLLATGRDSKGRPQAIYSLKHNQAQAEAKFARIHELSKKYKSIVKQNEEARKSDNPRTREAADCAHLIMKMGIRPGSDADTGAKVKAYGATNMLGKHVVVHDGKVRLQFTGKKGVNLDLPVHDKDVAKMLIERKEKAGDEGKLFGKLDESRLLDHVHSFDGGGFKTKDFRTHLANTKAMTIISKMEAPKNAKDYKKKVMEVAKEVAKTLGNTGTVALQSYISPACFSEWRTHV